MRLRRERTAAPGGDDPTTIWTGETLLDLRNGRDWDAGRLEVAVAVDTVRMRFQGREICVLDRDRFREWLAQEPPERDDLEVDDAAWMGRNGGTIVMMRRSGIWYTVTPHTIAMLRQVL